MFLVPRWAVVSAAAAPVLLVGGWTLAANRQPAGYDSTVDTISSLAAIGASDRWLMTAALFGLGACHLVTSLGLRPAPRTGRLVLGLGGVATLGVAAFPLPGTGTSIAHAVAALIAFLALASWPAAGRLGRQPRAAAASPVPWGLRTGVVLTASGVLLGLVGWFFVALAVDGAMVGLAERVAAGAQAIWPLLVVVSARAPHPGGLSPTGARP